ncbi:MAG: beta strand repeat-containing protein, partial [Chthoniobacterales bacterium]
MSAAHATTYSYTPTNGVGDTWAPPSLGWDATPVSATDTALVFGPATYTDGVAITNTNTNDIGAFTLNSLTLQGAGPLTTGFPIAVTITGGTLIFDGASPTINLNATNGGGTSTVTYNVASAMTLNATTAIAGGGNATFNLSGAIGGTGGIAKSGASVVTLSNANTYTGNTAINGGTIKIGAANNLGDSTQATNTISMNTGTLQSTGGTYDLGANRSITLNGAGTLQVDAGAVTVSGNVIKNANLLTVTGAGNTTISGVVSGSGGGLTKNGAGTLTLSNANTLTGVTTLGGGTIVASNSQAFGTGGASLAITGGGTTLNLATDTSINAYNTAITNGTTIQSNKATAASAGITHTLGTLSINASTLNITAGSNVSGGAPVVAFGAVSLTGSPTFNPTTAAITMGAATGPGADTQVNLGGTYTTTSSSIGSIGNIGAGAVNKSTTSTWTFTGTSSYTGTTTLSSGTTIVAADNAFGTTGTLQMNGSTVILQASGGPRIISNPTRWTPNGIIVGGSDQITLTGPFSYNISGTNFINFNNSGGTVINGAITLSEGTGGRTATFRGTGPIAINGAIQPNVGAATAQVFRYFGSNTLTLSN